MNNTRLVRIISAVFDLKDSTGMVSRPESLQYTSQYLQHFLVWLSDCIKKQLPKHPVSSLTQQGDGAQVIWEYTPDDHETVEQIIQACLDITQQFRGLSKVLMEVIPLHPLPTVLRCGIAEGDAAGVGLGKKPRSHEGYFGFCLALATRLQKVCQGISFSISARINLKPDQPLAQLFVRKISYMRGIGPEVIYVLKEEFDRLPAKARRVIRDLGEPLYADPSEGLLTHEDALEFADAINMRNTKNPVFLIVAAQKLKVLAERYENVAAILVEQAKVFRIGEKSDRLKTAIDLLEKAIEIDPTYKRAYFNRSCYYCLIAEQEGNAAQKERWILEACKSLMEVVRDEPTWRHWMREDPDLKVLREHPAWKDFEELPAPMPPIPF